MIRPKIKTVLLGLFAAFGLMFALFGWLSISNMQTLHRHAEEITTDRMPKAVGLKSLEGAFFRMNFAYSRLILSESPEEMAAAEKFLVERQAIFTTSLQGIAPLFESEKGKALVGDVQGAVAAYLSPADDMASAARKNQDAEARMVFFQRMFPEVQKVTLAVAALMAFNDEQTKTAFDNSEVAYNSSFLITLVLVAVCGLVMIGAAVFAVKGIASPVHNITAAMNRLAGGDASSAIPYAGRADEIGEMAAAVEVFRTNALANRRLEDDAARQRTLADNERLRNDATEKAKSDAMRRATSGLGDGLKHLASGKLNFQLVDAFAEDFESLRTDFNASIRQLAETMGAVAQSTGQIDSGTREISQSAEDLSKRTEQQAASLEETAAALDEITVNVANSSKRAEEARSVAALANASAAQSGTVVANAVNAMRRIEESSGQISNIIGVIDEIAFQTNLLALNAGVEAARAGDAGRGFAVVAQEVRELAQRSAKAAREIKELIRNSTAEVESGVKLVGETGDALKTIETYVVTINQHMDAIATSAREQSVGLAEVNTAVNQMDQVTQQNAAMVEETNAASATLANEACRLRELISQFVLDARNSSNNAESRGSRRAA